MAELVPYPFPRLLTRAFSELEHEQAMFHLPEKKFVRGLPGKDLSVAFHGHTAASPLGPAAGPQSQLAQNIVLSFLGGGRIFELKTVQIMDRLQIPRPCIDAQTIGYNVEWSQELTLEQSLEEYVKASMLRACSGSSRPSVRTIRSTSECGNCSRRPNPPTDLRITPVKGGRFLVQWVYSEGGQQVGPSEFRLYRGTGWSGVSFAGLGAVVAYRAGQTHFSFTSGAFAHGTRVSWAVRAVSPAG